MDKRKIIKIILVIVGLFIAMAVAEISIKGIGAAVQESSEKKEAEKKEQEVYNSEESVQSRQVEKFINDVYAALENGKYEVVYNLLDSTYRDCLFENEFEEFKSFVQEKLFLSDNHVIVETKKNSGKYRVLVGVTKEAEYKTQICTVEVIDENNCSIIFGDYIKLQKTSETKANSDTIKYELKYYYETMNLGVFVLKATNTSNNDVNIKISDIYAETTGGKRFEAAASGNFNLQANQTSEIKISYVKTIYSLDNLNFFETQNGKTSNIYMNLDEMFDVDIE